MPFHEGDMLGRYRIVEEIGAGGMGVVYRAFDERLGRDVAIKVVSDKASDDPEVISRFKREAKAVAKLAHPNIVALYDFVEEGSTVFAVMEYLQGETLQDRLQQDNLSVGETGRIGTGVVEGLVAAHEKRIVHRDMKPANIFLTSSGHPKVLDFGLAHRQQVPSPSDTTQSHDAVHTEAGTIMGTIGYMSPEQVRGQEVDARSDIFSFGAILYEMVTGERAFRGDTAVETMTAILHDTVPDPTRRDIVVPAPFDSVVQRCLAKAPSDRFQTTTQLLEALHATRADGSAYSWRAVATTAIVGLLLTAVAIVLWPTHSSDDHSGSPASVPAPIAGGQIDGARRAREEILPTILGFADEGNFREAFHLAQEIGTHLETDPIFNDVLDRISVEVSYHTNPEGAEIFVREYDRPEDPLRKLGVTPIDSVRIVRTSKFVRVEKEGYVSQEFLTGYQGGRGDTPEARGFRFALSEVGEAPDGMVLVGAGSRNHGLQGLKIPTGDAFRMPNPFLIDRFEVTNQQYKEFVDAGGYKDRELWNERKRPGNTSWR